MQGKRYVLKADIRTANPEAVEAELRDLLGADAIMDTDGGFKVTATVAGENARELNRSFLSALRRVEKKTILRAEWTNEGITERFFDYVPRGIRKT